MPGKSKLTADAAERAALRGLTKSEHRGAADRARAILLTLAGRRAGAIAAAILSDDVHHDGGWTLGASQPRLPAVRDYPARRAGDLAALALASTAPRGFAFRRPRHTLKGRRDKAAVAESRERRADLKCIS